MRPDSAPLPLRALGFGVAYILGAELGQWLSLEGDFATFWPPAGLYLAVLLRSRISHWPAFLLAALCANTASDVLFHDRGLFLGIAFGVTNSIEAFTGAYLLRKWRGAPFSLSSLSDVLALATVTVAISGVIGATAASLLLALVRSEPTAQFWHLWWTADVLGVFVFAPLALAFSTTTLARLRTIRRSRWIEGAALLALLVVIGHLIFSARADSAFAFPYFVLPLLLWIALRLGVNALSIFTAVLAVLTVGHTLNGTGPFTGPNLGPTEEILFGQAFLAVNTLSSFMLAAVMEERRQASTALARSNAELELRVDERTAELAYANEVLRSSEERFRTLASHAPVGIYLTDERGEVLLVNRKWSDLAGRPPDSALGSGWVTALHPEDHHRVVAGWGEAVRAERPYDAEFRFRSPDGRVSWLQSNAVLLRDERGRVTGYMGTVTDITGPKIATDAARESEERLRIALEAARMATWDYNLSEHGARRRQRAGGIRGIDSDGTTDIPDLIHPDDRARFEETLAAAMSGASEHEVEFRLVKPDGRVLWILDKGSLRTDPVTRETHLTGVSLDITDRKRAEEERGEAIALLTSVVASAPVGIAVFDTEMRYRLVNGPLAEMNGLTEDEHIGKRVDDVTPELYSQIEPRIRSVVETGEPVTDQLIESPGTYAAGTKRVWLQSFFPVSGSEGHLVGVGAIIQEITEQRRAEDELAYQRSLLQAITDNAQTCLFLIDTRGRGLFINPAAEEVTGYTKDEFIGTAVHDLVHPVHPDGSPYPAQDCPLHTALGFGDTLRGHEDVFLHKDGRLFPVRCNAQPVIRNGEPIAVVIEFWDITREKHADERLQKKNERLRLISDAAAVLLTASDPDTMMQELFTRVRDHLGVDAYFNFVADESTGALHLVSCAGIPRLAAESITHDFEHALYETIGGTPLGQIAPVHISNLDRADGPAIALVRRLGFRTYACSPLVYDDRLIGTLSFASHERSSLDPDDLAFLGTLSRYVTFAYVRLRLVERLREADRRKDEFLATLAHELRNPLAPIRHGLQVIRRSGIDDPLVDVARTTMERQLEQMVRLVDDLLDVSRITRNRLAIRKRPIALKDAIESAIETTQPLIDEARHSFSVELPPETILVDADPTRLAQVFANLLNNAAKYTEPGGEISLRAWIEGNEVVTSVKDTGIGIAREHLPKLFQMFSQVVPALERSRGGLGIGLSLVRGIVEMHGGRVEARSQGIGTGSEFIVRIPILVTRKEEPLSPMDSASRREESSPSDKRRILVVDDNHDAATMLALTLQLRGHEVATAHDGEEAIEKTQTVAPDVILLDIGLPKLNGYEACQRIRDLPGGDLIEIIALTGWGQDEDKRRAMEAGFDHHFTKPVSTSDLEALLERPRGR